MSERVAGFILSGSIAVAVFSLARVLAASQAPSASAQGQALPRTPEGKPNLSGIWQVMNTATWDIQDHSAQKGVPAGQGVVEGNEFPYQPWAALAAENPSTRRPRCRKPVNRPTGDVYGCLRSCVRGIAALEVRTCPQHDQIFLIVTGAGPDDGPLIRCALQRGCGRPGRRGLERRLRTASFQRSGLANKGRY